MALCIMRANLQHLAWMALSITVSSVIVLNVVVLSVEFLLLLCWMSLCWVSWCHLKSVTWSFKEGISMLPLQNVYSEFSFELLQKWITFQIQFQFLKTRDKKMKKKYLIFHMFSHKLHQTGWNLGHVFNSAMGHIHLYCCEVKLSILVLKT